MSMISRVRVARPALELWSRSRSRVLLRAASSSASKADDYELVVGLEIHAQLRTGRKLFSKARTRHDDDANIHVALLDAAFPGVLPVIDPEAVRLSVMTALALDCKVNPRSTFDRKHYFYHDIPASYQITQHYNPIAKDGKLRIAAGEYGIKRDVDVGIIQLQIEQDTAKSQTVGQETLVDLNRAGTGLMEIVTKPDMRSAEEAGAFVRKLQGLLRRVGSGDGDMEKGNLRVDANVSVRLPGEEYGTRCEIKNINSVRFLQQAIEAERKRHITHREENPGVPLQQETRGLNEITGETFSLRTKEEAQDYRYMPDSNLPALALREDYLEGLRKRIPEMPWVTATRLVREYDLDPIVVETILNADEYTGSGVAYLEEVIGSDSGLRRRASNWVAYEVMANLTKAGREFTPDIVPAPLLREIVIRVENRKLTGAFGRRVLQYIFEHGPTEQNLDSYLSKLNYVPPKSEDLAELCQIVIDRLPAEAERVRQGNAKVVMRLVGELMKESKGTADAKKARELFIQLLKP